MATQSWQTIVGFGSLLSEKSAKSTMPSLRNFRFAKLSGYRRVFAHPTNVFLKWDIGNLKTKELASLSVEPDVNANPFIVSVFEIPTSELDAFYNREPEFAFKQETVQLISNNDHNHDNETLKLLDELIDKIDGNTKYIEGIVCIRSTDMDYIKRWGQDKFDKEWVDIGLDTIWHWKDEIYPCRVYLRHCLLSIQKQGQFALDDFMDNTFLYDRKTTIRQYMQQNPDIYHETVPIALQNRYNG